MPVKVLLREYMESLIVAIIVAIALRFFVISAYKIPTGSMVPTLKVGDFIFAYKLPYGIPVPFSNGDRLASALPKRGDVVVFHYKQQGPNAPGGTVNYVKRVVGLPGDRIAIHDHILYINDSAATYKPLPDEVIQDLPGHEDYAAFEERFAGSTHIILRSRGDESDTFGPVIVPPGDIFVLGDNRDSSDDSRYWGTVPVKNLEGRVVVIWMSFDWYNRWADERYPSVRWDRVFKSIR